MGEDIRDGVATLAAGGSPFRLRKLNRDVTTRFGVTIEAKGCWPTSLVVLVIKDVFHRTFRDLPRDGRGRDQAAWTVAER